ncbi:hypothetical protein DIE00_02880 [Burkholderia sp. Bp8989]|nr:hypothetical protein DIE05_20240 [Burkholderia sp. Bp8995]RQS51696.1 hypothetical protein DIE00_02880 [Burkholderia sp. Bp8989]
MATLLLPYAEQFSCLGLLRDVCSGMMLDCEQDRQCLPITKCACGNSHSRLQHMAALWMFDRLACPA